jgi:hypothetical protein
MGNAANVTALPLHSEKEASRPYWHKLLADLVFGCMQAVIVTFCVVFISVQWRDAASIYPTIVPRLTGWYDYGLRGAVGVAMHALVFRQLRRRLRMSGDGFCFIPFQQLDPTWPQLYRTRV